MTVSLEFKTQWKVVQEWDQNKDIFRQAKIQFTANILSLIESLKKFLSLQKNKMIPNGRSESWE